MSLSSPKIVFDNRLLSIEELFRQRQYQTAVKEFELLERDDFKDKDHELGLYYSLASNAQYHQNNYKNSIELGLKSAKLLANLPLNKQYGRTQLILSLSYTAIGDLKNGEMRARDALSAYRRCNIKEGQADALNELAHVAFIRCDYKSITNFLEEALSLVQNIPKKAALYTGNLARIRIMTGQWKQAEAELNEVLDYNKSNNQEVSLALNKLSLGYLQLRLRKFILAGKTFDSALEIISRLNLNREKVIYLEYTGELALEKGDIYKAKSILSKAYEKGMLLASGSSLVSQSARRLAEVELLLDNADDAMKYGQKALDIALQIGEKVEVGLAKKIIAQIFSSHNNHEDAVEYITQSIDILRDVGDPLELGRTLMIKAELVKAANNETIGKTASYYEDALKIFTSLNIPYWQGEAEFKAGVFACQTGNLSTGFKRLNRSEKIFNEINDQAKLKAVGNFLKSLSEQAVAYSLSSENEYKIFGNLITPTEFTNLKSSRLEDILDILLKRSGADRALIYTPDFEDRPLSSSYSISTYQINKFVGTFEKLIGEEISKSKPTILLDCRRDPFIKELFTESADNVASLIVVPFKLADDSLSYLYLDKHSRNNLLNPFSQADLNFAVAYSDILAFKWAEIQKNKLIEDNIRLKNQLREKAAFPNIITKNNEMLDILAQVRQVVDSNISISIEGETGTGKDVLAQAIHYNSVRRGKRFISVNCAALPETLLESELFGYKRGAFTGADRDKSGLFEEADGGTFFLDEIGDMPLSVQAKVLRLLEEKELVRLGETTPRKVDVRVLSATNMDLKELMSSKKFRQDLYYRLTALTFRLPALRERKDDMPLLVDHFLSSTGYKVGAEVMKLLVTYDWPGNIRELENEIKKATLMSGEIKEIKPEVLSPKIVNQDQKKIEEKTQNVLNSDDIVFDENYSLYDYLSYHEKHFIIQALKEKNGIKKHAADLLNIPESTLRLKIKQYNIDIKKIKN